MNLGHWPPGGGFGNVSCRVQNVESKDNGRLAADKQASGVLAGGGGRLRRIRNVSSGVRDDESGDIGRLAADKQAAGVMAASGGLGMSRAGFEMVNLETLAA